MQCQNNLKQLMLAFHNYESANRPTPYPSTGQPDAPDVGFFPTGCVGPGAAPEDRLSWMVTLLPYLEQESLFKQFDRQKGYAANLPAGQVSVLTLLCPEGKNAAGTAATHYVAMAGIGHDAAARPAGVPGNGLMGYDRLTSFAAITDGCSNTIALMETRSGLGPWARGGESNLRGFDPADTPIVGDGRPFGGHATGMSVAMADASVRFLSSSVKPTQLAAAITVAGGEPFDLE